MSPLEDGAAGVIDESTGVNVNVDVSGSLVTIDVVHYHIHQGKHFFIDDWAAVSGAGTIFDLLLITGGTKYVHFRREFEAQDAFTFELYEAPTTSGGTGITIYNNNRISATAATVTAVSAPTVTALGTLLQRDQLSAGSKVGGGSVQGEDLILKQSTKYLFRFTKTNSGASTVDYKLQWYEVP